MLTRHGTLTDDDLRGSRGAVARALLAVVEVAGDRSAEPVDELVAALEAATPDQTRPELAWVRGVGRMVTGGEPGGIADPLARAGAIATLLARGERERVARLAAEETDAVAEVLLGPFGTFLAVPVVVAALARDHRVGDALLRRVARDRTAPVLGEAALVALATGDAALDGLDDDAVEAAVTDPAWNPLVVRAPELALELSDALDRWADHVDAVVGGPALPSSFGDARWDPERLHQQSGALRAAVADDLMRAGRHDDAAAILAPALERGARTPFLVVQHACAVARVSHPLDLQLPAPDDRAAMAERLEPLLARLRTVYDDAADRIVARRARPGDPTVVLGAGPILAIAHAAAGRWDDAAWFVDDLDELELDGGIPTSLRLVQALEAVDRVEEPAAPDDDLDALVAAGSGPRWLGAAAGLDLLDVLDAGLPVDERELATAVGRLGVDLDERSVSRDELRARIVDAVLAVDAVDARPDEVAAAAAGVLGRADHPVVGVVEHVAASLGDRRPQPAADPPPALPEIHRGDELRAALEEHLLAAEVRTELLARAAPADGGGTDGGAAEPDRLAGAWDATRLAAAVAALGNDPEAAAALGDHLDELADAELDARWDDALASGPARPALGDVESDLERIRVLRRLGRDGAARGIASALVLRAANGTLDAGYDPEELLLLVEELDASDEELAQLRAALASAATQSTAEGDGATRSSTPVTVLFVGGNETQEQYHADVEARLADRFHGRVAVRWFPTGWSARWGPEAERIESNYDEADAVVLMRFTRTQLGRRLRRSSGEAGLPWVACTGHGKASLLRAVERAVEVVDELRAPR